MAKRGVVTTEIDDLTEKLFGRRMIITELRLIPYIRNVAVNAQRIDPTKINETEEAILNVWKSEKWITMDSGLNITISDDFWRKTGEVMFVAYVDYKNRKD